MGPNEADGPASTVEGASWRPTTTPVPRPDDAWNVDWGLVAVEVGIIGAVVGALLLAGYLLEHALATATPLSPLSSLVQAGAIIGLGAILVGELVTGSPNLGVRRTAVGIETRNVIGEVLQFTPTPDGFRAQYRGRTVRLWSSGRMERPAYRVALSRRQVRHLGVVESGRPTPDRP